MPFLEVKNVSVKIKNEEVLRNVSFAVEKGETVAIIGPNGAGKTTLLKTLLGFLACQGTVRFEGKPVVGYVPQRIDIDRDLPLTVREFLNLVPQFSQKPRNTPKQVLGFVNLQESFLLRSISTLSTGEFQRILIAFALMNQPDVLLFDEPTASIDIAGQGTIYELLHRLQDIQHFALILISHDLTMVYRYADKVLCLNRTQICFGVPQEVLTPEELRKVYGETSFYHHAREAHEARDPIAK